MLNYLGRTRFRQETIVTMTHIQNLQKFKSSVPELPSNISSQYETFKSFIEKLYTTKSQESIQTTPIYLVHTHKKKSNFQASNAISASV